MKVLEQELICGRCKTAVDKEQTVCPVCGAELKDTGELTGESLKSKPGNRVKNYSNYLLILLMIVLAVIVVKTAGSISNLIFVDSLMDRSTISSADLAALNGITETRSYIFAVSVIITSLFYLFWLARIYRSIAASGVEGLKTTPAWSVIEYFIPVINLYLPYRTMNEIWKAAGSRPESEWREADTPFITFIWWSLFVTGATLYWIRYLMEGNVNTLHEIHRYVLVGLYADVILGISAVFLILIVNYIKLKI